MQTVLNAFWIVGTEPLQTALPVLVILVGKRIPTESALCVRIIIATLREQAQLILTPLKITRVVVFVMLMLPAQHAILVLITVTEKQRQDL